MQRCHGFFDTNTRNEFCATRLMLKTMNMSHVSCVVMHVVSGQGQGEGEG